MSFKVDLEKRVEWRDGAAIILRRLSKDEDAALDKAIPEDCNPADRTSYRGAEAILTAIRGWEGIETENGEPIPFNDETKYPIYRLILSDREMVDKITTFLRGPLGNLKTGLTSLSNGDGIPASAVNASETK